MVKKKLLFDVAWNVVAVIGVAIMHHFCGEAAAFYCAFAFLMDKK